MLDDLKSKQMHSVVYLIILLVFIIPFVLVCMWIFFGVFVLHWKKDSIILINSFKTAFILALPAFTLHSVCALIAAPYADGYEKPEPIYEDPLIDYFPGQQYYVIERPNSTKDNRRTK